MTKVFTAPALIWRSPSVEPVSGPTSWCVCLTVMTFRPRRASNGISRSTSVVLPEFFQPTMPTKTGGLATGVLGLEKCARRLEVGGRVDVEERVDAGAADLDRAEVGHDAA